MGEDQHLFVYRFEDEPRILVTDFTGAVQFINEYEECLEFIPAEDWDRDLMEFPPNTAIHMKGVIQ